MIIVKRLKILGVVLLIMGAIWIVPLVTSINVAESNKWETIQSSTFPIRGIEGNIIKLYSATYKKAMDYCYMCGSIIFCCVILGAECLIVAIKIDKLPINKKYGTVKEKINKKVIVEFVDGTREKFITEPKLIVMLGDFGIIDFKSMGSKTFGTKKEYMLNFEKVDKGKILDNPNKSFGI